MSRLALLLFLWCNIAFAQMHDVSEVWLNNGQVYEGIISKDTDLRLFIGKSVPDAGSGQEYSVSGYSVVADNTIAFNGRITVTKHKMDNGKLTVWGHYHFNEDGKGEHSGIFSGTFNSIIKINRKSKRALRYQSEFTGNWQNYERTLIYKTTWKNQ